MRRPLPAESSGAVASHQDQADLAGLGRQQGDDRPWTALAVPAPRTLLAEADPDPAAKQLAFGSLGPLTEPAPGWGRP